MSEMQSVYAVAALVLLACSLVVLFVAFRRVFSEVEQDEREFMDPLPPMLRLIWPLITFSAHYFGGAMKAEQVARRNRMLAQSGQSFMFNAQQFLGLQMVTGILAAAGCVIAALLLDAFDGFWVLCALVVGFFLPLLKTRELANKRRERIVRQLPTYLDYLSMSIQAGTNFTGAINHAVEKGPDGPFKEELSKVVRDLRAGMGRFDALRLMTDRIDIDSVNTFVNAVVQAEKTGASIGETLKIQASQRRIERFQLAEKKAMEAPVKLIFPLVAFIFPATFIVIGFPIGMKLWETLQ